MQFRSAEQYNQVFTLHGVVMVFLFIIPGIPAALGNVVLPMLGAKEGSTEPGVSVALGRRAV